ncbi:MAG TPA: alcohol dehydrogenase catalytic domain-containing protein [Terracidiphilus sp.]|nr:alcohol dehydrogenase catalytic domain-containing protein [Terracidiphilus sp.]
MRALVYAGPGNMVLEDRPRPGLGVGECEIAVTTAAICGSDLAAFLGRSRSRTAPMVLGHEFVGRRRDGRRVAANPFICCGRCAACLRGQQNLCPNWRLLGMGKTAGGHAEFVAIPESHVVDIPDQLHDARAVTAEPLANVVHLFRIAAPSPDCRVGIVGVGTMGAFALQMALRLGVREVLAEDVSEARLRVAQQMGATLGVNVSTAEGSADSLRFAGDGLDLVVDACGTATARQAAFDLCRPGGLVVLLGMASPRSEIDFGASIRKEHRVMMSFGYTPADFERSLAMLAAGEVDLTPWTAELPLEEGQQAFERMAGAAGETLKMLLRVS